MGNYRASPQLYKKPESSEGKGGSCKSEKKKRKKKEEEEKKSPREEPLAGVPPPTTPEAANVKLGVPPTKPSRAPSPEQPRFAGKQPKKEPAGAARSRAADFGAPPPPTGASSGQATATIVFPSHPGTKLNQVQSSEQPPFAGKQPESRCRSSATVKRRRLSSATAADRSHRRPRRRLHSIGFVVGYNHRQNSAADDRHSRRKINLKRQRRSSAKSERSRLSTATAADRSCLRPSFHSHRVPLAAGNKTQLSPDAGEGHRRRKTATKSLAGAVQDRNAAGFRAPPPPTGAAADLTTASNRQV